MDQALPTVRPLPSPCCMEDIGVWVVAVAYSGAARQMADLTIDGQVFRLTMEKIG